MGVRLWPLKGQVSHCVCICSVHPLSHEGNACHMQCSLSHFRPFCDGSHNKLEPASAPAQPQQPPPSPFKKAADAVILASNKTAKAATKAAKSYWPYISAAVVVGVIAAFAYKHQHISTK